METLTLTKFGFCACVFQGDLWAESSFLGYKLHFYACMEGEIYDVTEWAACQVRKLRKQFMEARKKPEKIVLRQDSNL